MTDDSGPGRPEGGAIARRHSRILTMVRELAFARDRQAVTGIVRSAARAITGADGITFVFREGSLCFYADEEAIAPLWKGSRFPMEACISGWVMLHDQVVAIPDIYRDDRIPHDAYRPTFVRSLLMVPVRNPQPIAAIGAYWASTRAATSFEIESLQMVADAAAMALTNVHIYEELRSALDAERRARQAAEKAINDKDNFLAILSHELRQPLAAATAAVHIQRLNGGHNAQVTDMISRQVSRMTRLVEDLLDASRIVRGDAVLQLARHDIRNIVHNAVETASSSIVERNHVLRVVLPSEPWWVDGDASRLEQIIVNLLLNASKYTAPGGRIDVILQHDDGTLRVRVQDTGGGIDPARLDEIFELFSRAPDAKEQGFGIGLAVARRLAEQHGGALRASSAGVGHGSEFILELPASSVPQCASA